VGIVHTAKILPEAKAFWLKLRPVNGAEKTGFSLLQQAQFKP
jgi:hypothetical protein